MRLRSEVIDVARFVAVTGAGISQPTWDYDAAAAIAGSAGYVATLVRVGREEVVLNQHGCPFVDLWRTEERMSGTDPEPIVILAGEAGLQGIPQAGFGKHFRRLARPRAKK